MDNPVDPYLGQTIRGYLLEEVLGHGKLMTLYRGHTQELWLLPETAIALIHVPDTLPKQTEELFLTRFSREASKLVRLRHSSLFPLFGYGIQDGYCYLLMPNATGVTLARRLKQQRRWQPADTIKVLTPIAQALDYIHSQGLVHQFLHPANILFQKGIPPQITGLRLSQMLMADTSLIPSTESHTTSSFLHLKNLAGLYSGMAEYLAPEVVKGLEPDTRSDIYSLGVIMFEMLSGQTPFTGENYLDIAFKHIREPLPSLHALCPDLPIILELVVDRALHRNPQSRFQTAGELITTYAQAISKHTHTVYPARAPRKERQTQPLSPTPTPVTVSPSQTTAPASTEQAPVQEEPTPAPYQVTISADQPLHHHLQQTTVQGEKRMPPITDRIFPPVPSQNTPAPEEQAETVEPITDPALQPQTHPPTKKAPETRMPANKQTTAMITPGQIGVLYPKNKEILAMAYDFHQKMEKFQAQNARLVRSDDQSNAGAAGGQKGKG